MRNRLREWDIIVVVIVAAAVAMHDYCEHFVVLAWVDGWMDGEKYFAQRGRAVLRAGVFLLCYASAAAMMLALTMMHCVSARAQAGL